MFASFCLIIIYLWVLNQLSLNCDIVSGSGLAPNGRRTFSWTNDDLTSLLELRHNNISNNNNNSKSIFSRVKQMTSIYFYTNISHPRGHTFQNLPPPPKKKKKNCIFFKYRILTNLPCFEKCRNGFEGRMYPNHFPKQKGKPGVSFRSWMQNCKNKCFPQNAKTMSYD